MQSIFILLDLLSIKVLEMLAVGSYSFKMVKLLKNEEFKSLKSEIIFKEMVS